MEKQSDIWFEKEGDNWFTRNKEYLGKKNDTALFVLDLYRIKPQKVLEIGCSNGFRLAAIHEKYGSVVSGVEPSVEALADGKKRYPHVKYIRGMAESFCSDEKYDLIIVNFVFHWIGRDALLKAVSNADSHLTEGGFLLLGDFGTENFLRRNYHHVKDKEMYTYKQRYQDMFVSSGSYREIARLTFNHDLNELSADTDSSNIGTMCLLKKIPLYTDV